MFFTSLALNDHLTLAAVFGAPFESMRTIRLSFVWCRNVAAKVAALFDTNSEMALLWDRQTG